ncbi:four helix bundle protein [Bdellovibrionota bacterium FG-1]
MARFQAYDVSLSLIPMLRPLVSAIAFHDRSLADQIRRAGSSVPLNISEGARRQGKDRLHAYRIAAGSAAEVRAALSVAHGWGYVDATQAQQADAVLDRILALLWRLTHAKA